MHRHRKLFISVSFSNMMAEPKLVGKITHYFTNIGVAVIELTGALKKGDKIQVKGASTDIQQSVDSMQIEHNPVAEAKKGQSIGLKTKGVVRVGDAVFKV